LGIGYWVLGTEFRICICIIHHSSADLEMIN